MNARAEAELKVLSERLAATGLDAMTRVFPRKIMSASPFFRFLSLSQTPGRELQQIIDDASIPGSPLHLCVLLSDSTRHTTERPEKKRKLDEHTKSQLDLDRSLAPNTAWTTLASHHLDESNPTNLEDAYSIIKAESSAMAQLTDQALTWFLLSHCQQKTEKLMTSKRKDQALKSDQNNREIREELLSELQRAQEAGINMHASITKTRLHRADLCSKIADHPEIDDYMLALQDHDEHQVLLLRQNIRDLRNVYIVLHDLVKAVIS